MVKVIILELSDVQVIRVLAETELKAFKRSIYSNITFKYSNRAVRSFHVNNLQPASGIQLHDYLQF